MDNGRVTAYRYWGIPQPRNTLTYIFNVLTSNRHNNILRLGKLLFFVHILRDK